MTGGAARAASGPEKLVTLGRIAGVYGIKGWVKIVSFTRPIDAILDYDVWFVGHPGDAKFSTPFEGKTHGTGLVAQIGDAKGQAIEDRDLAARWVGAEIAVPRSALPPTEGDEMYWFDLVGMAVRSSEGAALGEVVALTDNGAQDILVVRDGSATDEEGAPVQRLIPFVRGPIIVSVDLDARQIVAHWQPEW
jgi:16S rRNA processing protein RimM